MLRWIPRFHEKVCAAFSSLELCRNARFGGFGLVFIALRASAAPDFLERREVDVACENPEDLDNCIDLGLGNGIFIWADRQITHEFGFVDRLGAPIPNRD